MLGVVVERADDIPNFGLVLGDVLGDVVLLGEEGLLGGWS